MFKNIFLIIIIIKTTNQSNLDLLFMTPEHEDVLTLNEKQTIGDNYLNGWILSSDEPQTLNLYLYYNGDDENLILNYIRNDSIHSPSLYLFFTPELDCDDTSQNYLSIEIIKRVDNNVYHAKLMNILLPYSDKPLHLCLQQIYRDKPFKLYTHQGVEHSISIVTTKSFLPVWARVTFFVILLCLSGLFSGLNLGLMSLDLTELEMIKRTGTPREQDYATKIYPLRKRGNFLLCTILLGNVLVNSVSTLILGDLLSGLYAAFGSTILIVIFGEIIPQSACSRHGLAVGANTRYLTYFFMLITLPLSLPLSLILDKVLGKETPVTFSREKIRELMILADGLDEEEKKIINGAFDFNNKKVGEAMTKLDDVFMLELHSCLNFETIAVIAVEGYSRIPVYEKTRNNIVGLVHVKDFTLLDPDDNMKVEQFLHYYNKPIIFCNADETISSLFEEFRKGETHLAFVNDFVDGKKQTIGILTLEDIIEELVQMEIYDEFDEKNESDTTTREDEIKPMLDNETKSDKENLKLNKPKKSIESNKSIPESKSLSFFLQMDSSALISSQLRFTAFQFLFTTVKPFTDEFLTKNVLELIFKRAIFRESTRTREYLYKYGKSCNYFVLILCGEATIEVGQEKLEFPVGPLTYFGVNALLCGYESADQILSNDPAYINLSKSNKSACSKLFIPDFSLRVDSKCIYLKIDRNLWRNGVVKSWVEREKHQKSDSIDDIENSDVKNLDEDQSNDQVRDIFLSKKISSASLNANMLVKNKNKTYREFSQRYRALKSMDN